MAGLGDDGVLILQILNTLDLPTQPEPAISLLRGPSQGEKDVYEVILAGGYTLYFKFVRVGTPRAMGLPSNQKILLDFLLSKGLRVPKVLAVHEEKVVVEESLEGQGLCKLLEGFKWSSKNPDDHVDDSERDLIFSDIGAQMRILHDIDVKNGEWDNTFGFVRSLHHGTYESWPRYIEELGGQDGFIKFVRRCVDGTYITEAQEKVLVGLFESLADYFANLPCVSYVHTDIDVNNVMVCKCPKIDYGNDTSDACECRKLGHHLVKGIVDWTGVLIGDPLLDIGNWLTLFRGKWEHVEPLLKGYSPDTHVSFTYPNWKRVVVFYGIWSRLVISIGGNPEWIRPNLASMFALLQDI